MALGKSLKTRVSLAISTEYLIVYTIIVYTQEGMHIIPDQCLEYLFVDTCWYILGEYCWMCVRACWAHDIGNHKVQKGHIYCQYLYHRLSVVVVTFLLLRIPCTHCKIVARVTDERGSVRSSWPVHEAESCREAGNCATSRDDELLYIYMHETVSRLLSMCLIYYGTSWLRWGCLMFDACPLLLLRWKWWVCVPFFCLEWRLSDRMNRELLYGQSWPLMSAMNRAHSSACHPHLFFYLSFYYAPLSPSLSRWHLSLLACLRSGLPLYCTQHPPGHHALSSSAMTLVWGLTAGVLPLWQSTSLHPGRAPRSAVAP
jgi:hypothetical protein